jgi:hypothetical protein
MNRIWIVSASWEEKVRIVLQGFQSGTSTFGRKQTCLLPTRWGPKSIFGEFQAKNSKPIGRNQILLCA